MTWRRAVVAVALVVAVRAAWCEDEDTRPVTVRVASFNLENFPRSRAHIEGVFEEIRALDAAIVGVQEVIEPAIFATAARDRLGNRWRAVFPTASPPQRVGVLFDAARFELLSTRTYRETQVYDGGKPALEVRLQPRRSARGGIVRVIVVHFKAQRDSVHIRHRQYRALHPIMADAMRSGERVVLLGDFNATSPADRLELDALATIAAMTWASEDLECTSYWSRRDACPGTALDHVLTHAAPRRIHAAGPCHTTGCTPGTHCPRYVSDHCPVVTDL